MRPATADWTAPGAYEVSPGVHRVPLPLPTDGLRAVNVYALETDTGLTLVDGGWAIAEARARLAEALERIGRRIGHIEQFLVTHVHRDHYTQAVAIRREQGARVSLGAGDRRSLEHTRERALAGSRDVGSSIHTLYGAGASALAARMLDEGFGTGMRGEDWEPPDRWLRGGEPIPVGSRRTLVAVATPGHTQGHMVFTDDAAGLIFSGDHVLPHITPSVGFESVAGRLPLADYLASLRLVRDMPDRMMLPAHGAPSPSVHWRVDELLAHHERRFDACREALAAGGSAAYDVARRLPWTSRGRRFDDLDGFNQTLAVCETVAHLEVLADRGELTVTRHGRTRIYRR